MHFCNICKKDTNIKRHVGIGTLIAVLVTFGWWILAIPFYKKRCVFCKGSNHQKNKK